MKVRSPLRIHNLSCNLKVSDRESIYLPSVLLQKVPRQGYLPKSKRLEVAEDLRGSQDNLMPLLQLPLMEVGLMPAKYVDQNRSYMVRTESYQKLHMIRKTGSLEDWIRDIRNRTNCGLLP